MKNLVAGFLLSCLILSCASQKNSHKASIKAIRFIGEYILPNNVQFKGTTVGGLSSIDYSPEEDLYYFICDDRSDIDPVRFYNAKIKVTNNGFDTVEMVNVTYLLEPNGQPFHNRKQDPRGVPDPEAMRFDPKTKTIIWSSEGERTTRGTATSLINPSVYIAAKNGQYIDTFVLPANMQMKATDTGPRNNGVFEGVTFSNDFKTLYVNVEEPLYEDGYRAGLNDSSSWVRFIRFDVFTRKPLAQFAYRIDPVTVAPTPAGAFKVNGVTDILALNNHQLLVTERSFSTGQTNNNIRVYLVDVNDAEDVSAVNSLTTTPPKKPLQKKLLLNMDRLGINVYNIEGATFGPILPNGKRSLIFVSDNNFAVEQKTQFLLFEID